MSDTMNILIVGVGGQGTLLAAMVMRELAEQEPCVFVGRAAGYVLDQDEEIENLVRIFVYADRVRRVQRVMEVDCISEERAKKRIRKIENERKNYYKYFTGNHMLCQYIYIFWLYIKCINLCYFAVSSVC